MHKNKPTKLIRSLGNIEASVQGGIVTIGNFDGVHLGHQELLARVVAKARDLHVPAVVVTFEPHAFEFFAKGKVTTPRLTRLREKFSALAACGVDAVVILPFNQSLANQTASNFVTQVLQHGLRPKHVIIGDDFHFGRERQGDFSLLQTMGGELGFSVEAMHTVEISGERVSSTRIRQALVAGDLNLAKLLLGRPYSMLGRVRHGDKLGRKLGFPTANIFLHRQLAPVSGIYTVYMHGLGPLPLPGVANVGVRPTVDGTRALLEVHLLDFNQDIYGRYVQVEFCKKLRDEERYPNLELLTKQIAKDVDEARKFFD